MLCTANLLLRELRDKRLKTDYFPLILVPRREKYRPTLTQLVGEDDWKWLGPNS